jgi:acyl-CoA thioesterase
VPTRFLTDTAVTARGDGRYAATIDPSWWIIRGPNGGYLAAIVARALLAEVADTAQRLRSLTLHYLRAPEAGPCLVDVTVERRGRTLTSLSLRMTQDDRLVVLGLAATAVDRPGPDFADLTLPPAQPPVEPTPPLPVIEGAPTVPMREHYEMQPRLGPDRAGGETADVALTGGWIRLADHDGARTPVDDVVVAALTDAWAPAVFARIAEPLGVPTIDLTIHFRDEPPARPDWTFARFRTRHAAGGYVEEDGELWSSDGRLLAQSRQLAVALPM